MDVIIETAKGSRQKYVFDEKLRLFRLKKVLPAGLAFPFDFGFIPGTKGEDGDPLDVLVLSEFTGFPGCVYDVRLIGCLQATQTYSQGKMIRNDRYLAVPEQSVVYKTISSVEELAAALIAAIETFFITYLKAEGTAVTFNGRLSAAQAWHALQPG